MASTLMVRVVYDLFGAAVTGPFVSSGYVAFSFVLLAPPRLRCTRPRLQSRGGGDGEAQGSSDAVEQDAVEQAVQQVAALSAQSVGWCSAVRSGVF